MICTLILAPGKVEHIEILRCSNMAFNNRGSLLETLVFIYVSFLPNRIPLPSVNLLDFLRGFAGINLMDGLRGL